jgi:LmbE family N-acetylglucosaminyl deacetylase
MPQPNRQHVIIAPHCDDALLALGGIILQQPADFTVVTIFGTCAWTALPERYPLEDVTRLNQLEERQALAEAGCELVLHEYPEALFRGYRKWNTKRPHTDDRVLAKQIKATIQDNITAAQRVYFPLAPGRHIDHVLVADRLHELYDECQVRDIEVYVYEDLPYSWYGGIDEALAELATHYLLTPEIIDISLVMESKLALLRNYKTQLVQDDLDKISDYAGSLQPDKPGTKSERIWHVTRR